MEVLAVLGLLSRLHVLAGIGLWRAVEAQAWWKRKEACNATVAISASRHLINIQTTVQTHKTMEKSESVLNNAHCGITGCGLAAAIHEDFTFLFSKQQSSKKLNWLLQRNRKFEVVSQWMGVFWKKKKSINYECVLHFSFRFSARIETRAQLGTCPFSQQPPWSWVSVCFYSTKIRGFLDSACHQHYSWPKQGTLTFTQLWRQTFVESSEEGRKGKKRHLQRQINKSYATWDSSKDWSLISYVY